MKTNYLFPHRLKSISGVLFIISFITLVVFYSVPELNELQLNATVFAIIADADNGKIFNGITFFGCIENSIADELLVLIVLTSGIIYAFSKEKNEDEMVASIRLQSLAWATIINYALILLSYLFVYGFIFLNVLMAVMFSQLLIFILLFRFKMFRFYNSHQDEE
ncbi:hypothetical protein [Flavobacterium cerinum]|uniref:Uncharacterized protein n=1 Tax=Flavobacterium cerinum TaxID=2502784 RepID=A0A3S3RJ94_9FLAO|nr:hypothetical protein [Flavobacterium cerinum]RWX00003.1 hypothetical protein EPI11_10690 [Flavobacterium cerinum]